MYSFYYVATGLKNADCIFIQFLGQRGFVRSVGSCYPRIMLNVANSVGTEL